MVLNQEVLNQPVVLANVFGPDVLVVLGVVVLLFGGSQIPKLARSLGQASKEFKQGQEEKNSSGDSSEKDEPPTSSK